MSGFVKFNKNVAKSSKLKSADKIIYSVIASYGSKGFYGSLTTLAKYSSFKTATQTRESVKRLIGQGLVNKNLRNGRTTVYVATNKKIGDGNNQNVFANMNYDQVKKFLNDHKQEIEDTPVYMSQYSIALKTGIMTKEYLKEKYNAIDDLGD